MDVKQIYSSRMANFAYLVEDSASKTAAVIDPSFDPETDGCRITHVINTHGHSDHVSGNAAILEATKADLLIHEADADQVSKLLNRALSRVMGGKGSPRATR